MAMSFRSARVWSLGTPVYYCTLHCTIAQYYCTCQWSIYLIPCDPASSNQRTGMHIGVFYKTIDVSHIRVLNISSMKSICPIELTYSSVALR